MTEHRTRNLYFEFVESFIYLLFLLQICEKKVSEVGRKGDSKSSFASRWEALAILIRKRVLVKRWLSCAKCSDLLQENAPARFADVARVF